MLLLLPRSFWQICRSKMQRKSHGMIVDAALRNLNAGAARQRHDVNLLQRYALRFMNSSNDVATVVGLRLLRRHRQMMCLCCCFPRTFTKQIQHELRCANTVTLAAVRSMHGRLIGCRYQICQH